MALFDDMLAAYKNSYNFWNGPERAREVALSVALGVAEAALGAENRALKLKIEALESMRPHWAKGYTSDSVAAQCAFGALAQLWAMLGAKDQTDACAKLEKKCQHSTLSRASADVFNERARQQAGLDFDASWDDRHNTSCELSEAAICYADNVEGPTARKPVRWPWNVDWWKPKSRRQDLVRAAALLIAEIERIDRAEARK